MWKIFDQVYVINLPHRTDRLYQVRRELRKFAIPFKIVNATFDRNGEIGLYKTMMQLFSESVEKNILVFEDDVSFLCNPIPVINNCIKELPRNWDLLYFGSNILMPVEKVSNSLLILKKALSTHAVAYSKSCIERILQEPQIIPYDRLLADKIQSLGNSYMSYPMIATQRPGLSDIKKFAIDWNALLLKRYSEATKFL